MTEDDAEAAEISKSRQREDEDAAFEFMWSHPAGRAFAWHILSMCGIFGASFSGEDTHQSAFREGRRDIGCRLLADLEHRFAPAYGRMSAEHIARLERYHVMPPQKEDDE